MICSMKAAEMIDGVVLPDYCVRQGERMQLWGKRQEENPAEFWRKTGEKRGGTIGLFTFATLLGRSGNGPLGLPGLLYTVGDRVWFEDFERDNWLSKLLGSRQKYEKTELSFDKNEVTFSRVVSRGGAYRCIGGRVAPDALVPMSGFSRLFAAHALQVGLRDSSSVFLEILREEEFRSYLGK